MPEPQSSEKSTIDRLHPIPFPAWLRLRFDDAQPRRLAQGIDAPLLVVHDRGDDEVAFEEGEELVRNWPGAEMVETAGLGHYRPLRDAATIERVIGFLDAAPVSDQDRRLPPSTPARTRK